MSTANCQLTAESTLKVNCQLAASWRLFFFIRESVLIVNCQPSAGRQKDFKSELSTGNWLTMRSFFCFFVLLLYNMFQLVSDSTLKVKP